MIIAWIRLKLLPAADKRRSPDQLTILNIYKTCSRVRKSRESSPTVQHRYMLALQKNLYASEIECLAYTEKWRYVVVCYVWIVFASILALIFLFQKSIRFLLPRQIIKVTHPTVGGQQWSDLVTYMVIKFLTHRIPTESITYNILAICRIVSTNNNIIGSLPGVDFVHKW